MITKNVLKQNELLLLPPNFSFNLFKLPRFSITTINTTNSNMVIGRAIFLKNKNEILSKNPHL
jgi:hypothetical protein